MTMRRKLLVATVTIIATLAVAALAVARVAELGIIYAKDLMRAERGTVDRQLG